MKESIIDALCKSCDERNLVWYRPYFEKNWNNLIENINEPLKHGFRGLELVNEFKRRGINPKQVVQYRFQMSEEYIAELNNLAESDFIQFQNTINSRILNFEGPPLTRYEYSKFDLIFRAFYRATENQQQSYFKWAVVCSLDFRQKFEAFKDISAECSTLFFTALKFFKEVPLASEHKNVLEYNAEVYHVDIDQFLSYPLEPPYNVTKGDFYLNLQGFRMALMPDNYDLYSELREVYIYQDLEYNGIVLSRIAQRGEYISAKDIFSFVKTAMTYFYDYDYILHELLRPAIHNISFYTSEKRTERILGELSSMFKSWIKEENPDRPNFQIAICSLFGFYGSNEKAYMAFYSHLNEFYELESPYF